MRFCKTIATFFCFLLYAVSFAQGGRIIVDPRGSGNFTSIQAAINSLPDSSVKPRTIYIKNGVYNEKVFVAKHNIIFEGESCDETKITQSIARDEWRCEHPDDWGVAILNLNGNDITLKNLTIINDYGFTQTDHRTVLCKSDSTGKKVITKNSHQMALRSMNTTRLKAVNCRFNVYAGNTVSPWNLIGGMFYFKECIMDSGADFYCHREWAYAENCTFYTNTGPAAIWHDGSTNADYKTVLKNCRFDGYEEFRPGRYHKDAQFYLINCSFSKTMTDEDIYFVTASNNKLPWGSRIYHSNCRRDGGDYSWFQNNLKNAKGSPSTSRINPKWVFEKAWRPEKNS